MAEPFDPVTVTVELPTAAADAASCSDAGDPAGTAAALAVTPFASGETATENVIVEGPPTAAVVIVAFDEPPAPRLPDDGSMTMEKSALGSGDGGAVPAVVTETDTAGDDGVPFVAIAFSA